MAPYSCFFFLGFFGCFLVTIPFLSRVTRTAEKETSLAPSSVLFRFSPALFLPSEACCFSLEPGQCPKYEGQFDFLLHDVSKTTLSKPINNVLRNIDAIAEEVYPKTNIRE